MAAANISTALFYQPWKQQGVDFLLQQDPVPAELSLCHAKAPQPKLAAHAPRPYGQRAQAQSQFQRQHTPEQAQKFHAAKPQPSWQGQQTAPRQNVNAEATKPNTSGQNQHGQNRQVQQPPFDAAPPPSMPQVPTQRASQGHMHPSLPREAWPQAWQERFHATKPARVIWTYWNLGHDLCGDASDARRHLLRKILSELKHPAGTHSFWPMALPQENSSELVPNIPVFWSGVRMLNARVLIILGDAGTKALGYNVYDMPFKEFRKQDKLVILAKDMEVLMEKPHMYSMLMNYLRPHLTQYLQLV